MAATGTGIRRSVRTSEHEYTLAHGRIVVGDALALLATLPRGSIDMVFADPPYNLGVNASLARPDGSSVSGVDAAWDRFGDHAAYDVFTRAWLAGVRDALKPDGTVWVTGTYHNIFRVGAALQDMGFWILNDIVWRKANPMPNFRGRRFTNAHETILWAAKSKRSRYRFDYAACKALNEGTQMRSDWFVPVCAGRERLRDEAGVKLHPTQKPEWLLYRAVLAASAPGDIILDPFFGTGTTGAVATRLGRRFIGFEAEIAYARAAKTRIETLAPAPKDFLPDAPPRERPRVPFGALVERGVIRPGAVLRDAMGAHSACVLADGNLRATAPSGRLVGSIHSVAREIAGRSVNGWQFWHLRDGARSVPIDDLRERLRAGAA